jgi:hypothetical protein
LKLKSLLVITLLVIGCSFASAQTFGFLSAGGIGEYCNYEQLTNEGSDIYAGVDNLSACDLATNGTVSGFGVSVPKTLAAGLPVTGKGVVYGDNIYDAEEESYSGFQWSVLSQLHASHKIGDYGWIGVASVSGFYAGDNYGYLSATIPEASSKGNGTTVGKIPAIRRK